VSSNGTVDKDKFPILKNWAPTYGMETVLTNIKNDMAAPANRKLAQPKEGDKY